MLYLSWCHGAGYRRADRPGRHGGRAVLPALLLGICLAATAGACLAADDPPAHATAFPVEPGLPPSAEALFRNGHFLEAAALAEKRNTAEGLAFAARATLMHAGYVAKGDRAVAELKRGEALARRAVDMNPDMVEGLLELVIALGYHSRQEGYLQAHEDGYGKEAGRLIEKAMDLAPNMGWARAAFGGWNAEIVARGGAFLGKLAYGASRKTAIQSFEKAIMLDPDNATIRVEYAKALIRMEPRHPDLDKIRAQLRAALAKPARGAVDKIIQDQGRELLDAVDSGKPGGLEKVVDRLTPFEN